MRFCKLYGAVLAFACCATTSAIGQEEETRSTDPPRDPRAAEVVAPLEITADTTLDPARTYGAILIKKSGITLDGRGAWLLGPAAQLEDAKPTDFRGAAILAEGVSDVVIKNVNAKGWESGLVASRATGWHVEGCNFSDNFHDPEFGWGENGRRGGIVFTGISKSKLIGNTANRVWDACCLIDCTEIVVTNNDFSHTSNTCLKMWNARRCIIEDNNLSYGIRKKPNEVHARDSTCVLMESGSNFNVLRRNDCRYGGDGIFVRVLNGWVSTDNLFEENDTSYANNNCVEAWSPRNTYIRNKANHGSYGFWLGASDQTKLIDNEASYNGLPTGNHNSPHLPGAGHAGIVFMFGPSSHTICRGNRCIGNHGAGIAAIGDLAAKPNAPGRFKAFHWIVERNTLQQNRWGIYLKNADWIRLAANTLGDNASGDVVEDGGVTNLVQAKLADDGREPPVAVLAAPSRATVGESVVFDARGSKSSTGEPLEFRYDLGDGTIATDARVEHVYDEPGFYRVGLTVHDGLLADLAWRDFYVVEALEERATEGQAADWTWADAGSKAHFVNDTETRIAGKTSIAATISPYSGGRVALVYPKSKDAGWSLDEKSTVVFWLKAINENLPAWQDFNPVVTLHKDANNYVRLAPSSDLLSQPPYTEAREGWTYFRIPLDGDSRWKREEQGTVDVVNFITISVDSWGAPPLRIWLDALAVK